ncbi:nitrate ABC transporter substrate-binding protein [Guyparkeria sp. SB14A]|uniref:ABC transporter substrate-binding protein n=1 Tax=Guyparkeria sp. SB14A TaxID=2571147 RepID=UPI0010ACC9EA|nr:ABC transporter substrate-binding protein [Guyparkeria sp. SB14A]TKA89735.1 nitrate ABC transporter substrate-binding protein [Guyparkeria sp. SB14A]
MDRRRFLALTPLALGVSGMIPFLGGCRQDDPLRVSYHPWVGYETLYLAERFAWLPEAATLTRRQSASESLAALQKHEADAAALTLDEVIRARVQGMDLVVVMVFNVSAGADALVVNESIKRLEQLEGKRIGAEGSAVGAMLLDRVLEKAGLGREQVTVVDLPIDSHVAAWEAGDVEALVSYEPTVARLRRLGAVRMADSRDFPDTIFDVFAVRRDCIDHVEHTLLGLIDAHFRALEHLRFNRQDALYRIADVESVSPDDVRQALGGVLLPDRRANQRYLSAGSRLTVAAAELQRRIGTSGGLQGDWFTDAFLPRRHARAI